MDTYACFLLDRSFLPSPAQPFVSVIHRGGMEVGELIIEGMLYPVRYFPPPPHCRFLGPT
jgi:hypothetical protein